MALAARARPLSGSPGCCVRLRIRGYARGCDAGARTINLAEPATCARPRQLQRLVSADLAGPCPHSEPVPKGWYAPTRVVPVRVCRREDLERACQPKVSRVRRGLLAGCRGDCRAGGVSRSVVGFGR